MAQERLIQDPYGNYYFALEIAGPNGPMEIAHFQECSGLKNASTVFEIEEGGLNGRTHKRPGQSKWEHIVLKYATSGSLALFDWREQYLQEQFTGGLRTKYSGSISLKNNNGEVVRCWHFTNAWPVAWEGPSLSSGGSDLAVETIELAHDGLKVANTRIDPKG